MHLLCSFNRVHHYGIAKWFSQEWVTLRGTSVSAAIPANLQRVSPGLAISTGALCVVKGGGGVPMYFCISIFVLRVWGCVWPNGQDYSHLHPNNWVWQCSTCVPLPNAHFMGGLSNNMLCLAHSCNRVTGETMEGMEDGGNGGLEETHNIECTICTVHVLHRSRGTMCERLSDCVGTHCEFCDWESELWPPVGDHHRRNKLQKNIFKKH